VGLFAVGDVLLVNYPFSNLAQTKIRPAVVAALSDFDNVVLCQITSQTPNPSASLVVDSSHVVGKDVLRKTSYIRANKMFTADPGLVVRKLGSLKPQTRHRLHATILNVFGQLINED